MHRYTYMYCQAGLFYFALFYFIVLFYSILFLFMLISCGLHITYARDIGPVPTWSAVRREREEPQTRSNPTSVTILDIRAVCPYKVERRAVSTTDWVVSANFEF